MGTTNAKVYFDYAMMLQGQDGKDPEIGALLRKAVELKPDLMEAHYMLGFYASNVGRFAEAVDHLRQVKKLEHDQAFPYFRALAYAYYRLGRMEEARKNAERAVKFATEPKDVELAKEFLGYLAQEPSKREAKPQDGLKRRDAPAEIQPQ
jgi:tetratricopeptide (TPR) repeat protein